MVELVLGAYCHIANFKYVKLAAMAIAMTTSSLKSVIGLIGQSSLSVAVVDRSASNEPRQRIRLLGW